MFDDAKQGQRKQAFNQTFPEGSEEIPPTIPPVYKVAKWLFFRCLKRQWYDIIKISFFIGVSHKPGMADLVSE